MNAYVVVLAGFGAVVLMTAWLPLILKELPLSLPIICVLIGLALFLSPVPGAAPLPLEHPELTERATELVVIVALMGAGLKLDRPFGWRRWGATWRLLGPTMLLSIAAMTALAVALLGFDLPTALLLGALLAPTDPVLASDVQVGGPNSDEEEDEVRFALTSEAGLNDGLAFPFVHLAVALAGLTSCRVGSGRATGSWSMSSGSFSPASPPGLSADACSACSSSASPTGRSCRAPATASWRSGSPA